MSSISGTAAIAAFHVANIAVNTGVNTANAKFFEVADPKGAAIWSIGSGLTGIATGLVLEGALNATKHHPVALHNPAAFAAATVAGAVAAVAVSWIAGVELAKAAEHPITYKEAAKLWAISLAETVVVGVVATAAFIALSDPGAHSGFKFKFEDNYHGTNFTFEDNFNNFNNTI